MEFRHLGPPWATGTATPGTRSLQAWVCQHSLASPCCPCGVVFVCLFLKLGL